MAETRVQYQVNGRPFEGLDRLRRQREDEARVVFMQPDWKGVCADTIAQARIVAGKDYVVLMADMFGAGYGDTPKTREQLAAGMKAVHDDLAFTLLAATRPMRPCSPRPTGSAWSIPPKGSPSATARAAASCSNRRAPARISKRSSCST